MDQGIDQGIDSLNRWVAIVYGIPFVGLIAGVLLVTTWVSQPLLQLTGVLGSVAICAAAVATIWRLSDNQLRHTEGAEREVGVDG